MAFIFLVRQACFVFVKTYIAFFLISHGRNAALEACSTNPNITGFILFLQHTNEYK